MGPIAVELGFIAIGAARAEPVPIVAAEQHRCWLERGFHGKMSFMERHPAQRRDPRHKGIVPGATAVIACAVAYGGGAAQSGLWRYVAAHARARDYHLTLAERLAGLAQRIAARFPGSRHRVFTDSAPLMERTWALAAGLGGLGKNGALIVPNTGCAVVLGEVVCSGVPAPTPQPLPEPFQLCDVCTACMDACPTRAIVAPGIVDSRRCLSYQSIENTKSPVPPELASSMELIFGCDTCTSVCPLNRPDLVCALEPPPNQGSGDLDLKALYHMSERALVDIITDTALGRTGARAIRRNAGYVLEARGAR